MVLELENISTEKLYEIIGWLDLAGGPSTEKDRYMNEISKRSTASNKK